MYSSRHLPHAMFFVHSDGGHRRRLRMVRKNVAKLSGIVEWLQVLESATIEEWVQICNSA
jgi:hypothetical protein